MSDTSDELDAIVQQMLVDYTAWVNGEPVAWNVKKQEAKAALIHWKNQAIRAEMLSMIGEHETEYSNLDGDAGYWEKHGRNQFRDKLRQQVISRYGAEDGGIHDE